MRKTDLFKRSSAGLFLRQGNLGYLSSLDAHRMLAGIRDEIADLVFLDPPFNLGKDYGKAQVPESLLEDAYYDYLCHLLNDCIRIMKPGGALFLYHLPYWAARFFETLSRTLSFRHWIAISMKNGFARGDSLYPAHYALLYFSKGHPRHFTRPKIEPQICFRCKRQLKDYGGYQRIIDEKGINLSDVWDDLSPVRHKSKKYRSANQLPLEFTDRVLAIAGSPSGVLVDPFVGTGTSLVSATKLGMKFLGNDLNGQSINICRARLGEHMQ